MRHVLAIVISLLLAAQVGAQSLPQVRPGDGESGLREMLGGAEARAWGAVGRLDTGASFCSATLITPDLVLTAAHCVFHPRTSEAFSPDELTFLAGLRNGQAEAIRQVRRIIVLPDYVPQDGPEFEMIGRDLALLELRQPVSVTTITPIPAREDAGRRGEVTVVSYGADRESYASIEEDCEILARQGSVRSLSCHVVSGSSGSPVLLVSQGRAEVIAVISATAQVEDDPVSLAVMLDGQLDALMDLYRNAAPGATFSTNAGTTSFITPSNDGRDGIGARFLRP